MTTILERWRAHLHPPGVRTDIRHVGGNERHAVQVCLTGLDGTTARSVSAFIEAKLSDRFALSNRDEAVILLVDLDQPAAPHQLETARDDQVVLGVGFEPLPPLEGCRRYLQKPLTGTAITDALAEATNLGGTRRRDKAPSAPRDRFSHARDVFTKGTSRERRPRPVRSPADWQSGAPRPRLDRKIHERATTLIAEAAGSGSSTSAAELLGQRQTVELVPARDGGDLSDPKVLASYQYASGHHLDGLIRRAEREHPGRVWEIRGPALSIIADPESDALWVNVPNTRLRRLCIAPIGETWRVGRSKRRSSMDGYRRIPTGTAVWNATIWASQGRLPDDLDPSAPVRLRAWPDLTRYQLTPSVLPIVALLASSPTRPVDVAKKLGVSRSHAFVVVAAAHHLDLLEDPGEAPTALTLVASTPRSERGVLRRLLGRLRAA